MRHEPEGDRLAAPARERGAAAIEFALALPLLAGLSLLLADLLLTSVKAREADGLARAGVDAVVRRMEGQDLSSLVQPLVAGVAHPRGLVLPPLTELVELPAQVLAAGRLFRGCPVASTIQPAPGLQCPDGTAAAAYAEVSVEAPVQRVIPWPESVAPATVAARAYGRLP